MNFATNSVTNNAGYGRLTGVLIAAWFIFALSASALHLFKTNPDVPPLAMGLAVLIPLVVFLLWFRTSAGFREFALSLNPGVLTFVQSWRIAGLAFLALYTVGPAGGFRVARGLGRHRHRSNRTAGSAQACELQAAEKFYLVAGPGDI